MKKILLIIIGSVSLLLGSLGILLRNMYLEFLGGKVMNAWIKELINNLDVQLEENKRIQVMEACGEKCPFTHLTDEKLLKIKKDSKNKMDFIEKLSHQWCVEYEDKEIYVVFDKCYCPLVNGDISGASKTLCYCTQGNIKKKFRLGLGREVDVLMEKTILAGDSECRFKVLV